MRAYLYLGKIALLNGDLVGARREMAAAQRANPPLFARLVPRLLDDERFDGDMRAGTAQGAQPRGDAALPRPSRAESSPFTAPISKLSPDAPSWFWYLDASGQGGSLSNSETSWPQSADETADHEDWPVIDEASFEEAFWSHLRDASDAEDSASDEGPWWHGASGLQDEFEAIGDTDRDANEPVDADAPNFGEEAADDAPSWERSPLASFYEELASAARDPEASAPAGDFSSEAEVKRFRDLPPIARDDFEDLDWDVLHARLADEFDG